MEVTADQEAFLTMIRVTDNCETIGNAMEIVKIGKKLVELLQFTKFAIVVLSPKYIFYCMLMVLYM